MYKISNAQVRLGKRIRKHRKELGLSQEELAERADISRAHMGHIEQGRKNPSLDILKKIAKSLKVRVSDLIPY